MKTYDIVIIGGARQDLRRPYQQEKMEFRIF